MGACEDCNIWSHQLGGCKKDPMSHRIIEKRRRDRMNNCLADLSRLIPAEYLKKGRGRIEKTEIIEMAIKHMKFLQAQTYSDKAENYETKIDNGHHIAVGETSYTNAAGIHEPELAFREHYKYGYQECLAETMHFLVELEGFYPSDTLCLKLMNHLQKYFEKITQGDKVVYRSPLENVVSPNAYEPKVNSCYSSSISDVEERDRRNSVISVAHCEENSPNENITNTSQLREMLVGPHLGSFYTSTSMRPNTIRGRQHSSPEPLSSSSESITTEAASSHGSLFKFKNYIKERFSAEHSNLNYIRYNTETSNCISLTENKSPASSVVVGGTKRKPECIDECDNSSTLSPPKELKHIDDHYRTSPKPVPIFALHAKGAFYIPLSVDSHLLTPFLTELNNDYGVSGFSPSMVLHPVTISVNFNRPSLSKPNEFKTLLSQTISHHSNTPLHVVPECT